MGLRYYLATRVENWFMANEIADALNGAGWSQSYRWTENGCHGKIEHLGEEVKRETSRVEINGVKAADVLIALLPGGRGTNVEIGCALGLDKPIFLWSESKKGLEAADGLITPFYYHQNVTKCICKKEDVVKNVLMWSKKFLKEVPSGLWR